MRSPGASTGGSIYGAAVLSEVLAVPKIHCTRKCLRNLNPDDHCELPDTAIIYLGVLCSAFRARPLPEPVPMISNLIHERAETKRSRHRKVWK